MITFLIALAALIAGYFLYGRFVDRFFGTDPNRPTPVRRMADGVDYIELKPWRMFIIQFLNIAGLGPVFGAILGAAYGPVSYLWIVLGCIFMGASHDFFSGMLSLRHDGRNMPDITGKYLGPGMKKTVLVITALLLPLVGASFVTGPADLLSALTGWNRFLWVYLIFAYYILATLLPIDKIIGKVYPLMGGILLFMALAVGTVLTAKGLGGSLEIPELGRGSLRNFHSDPEHNILLPMLFVVISCGAISGFHSTQSPLMARCMSNERYGRPVFYGAMICEGIVALIWATAAMAYFGGPEGLNAAADAGKTPAIIVNEICNSWMGRLGAFIAILGVVVCPVTSGDTAFRSLRLVIADAVDLEQKPMKNRLLVAIPVFAVALVLCNIDFTVIWKYVSIGNQCLACIMLWTGAVCLERMKKNHLILSLPATFLTFICITYFLIAPHIAGGLFLNRTLSYAAGTASAVIAFAWFLYRTRKDRQTQFMSRN